MKWAVPGKANHAIDLGIAAQRRNIAVCSSQGRAEATDEPSSVRAAEMVIGNSPRVSSIPSGAISHSSRSSVRLPVHIGR